MHDALWNYGECLRLDEHFDAQYGHEAQMQTELPIINMSAYTENFAGTLAVASLCERVITIDTSYFHLYGAAGLPTWLLLCEKCDWRNSW
ncbi:hypothetical protein GCM10009007_16990 [Formosimonas limnophila]|uniref:Uncharacterized protein n=1 Tax=Formosimonas limnophila TaxID=1384487 RepID=A0A8J3FYW0_9BURK|nr:hypothetical protein [Formosimonas limnophila]GHA76617.1 hypothetical protein GCM10009007_16990 [Formosimonas limnophila]